MIKKYIISPDNKHVNLKDYDTDDTNELSKIGIREESYKYNYGI